MLRGMTQESEDADTGAEKGWGRAQVEGSPRKGKGQPAKQGKRKGTCRLTKGIKARGCP